MKVLVTGSTGFIGSHIVKELSFANHNVIATTRNKVLPKNSSNIKYKYIDFNSYTSHKKWLGILQDIDVVINAVGIITQNFANSFATVHKTSTISLFKACEIAGVKKIIHISALGVSEDSNTLYNNTKIIADKYLEKLNINYLILRPSWLYGSDSKSMQTLSAFSTLPIVPVLDKGANLVQPIYVQDFAKGIVKLLGKSPLDKRIIEVGGLEKLTIKKIHTLLATRLGRQNINFIRTPIWLTKLAVKIGDYILQGSINSASFDMLLRNNITDATVFWEQTAISPKHMEEALALNPPSSAERLEIKTFFALPLLRLSLAFIWIITAMVVLFITPKETTFKLLYNLKFSAELINPIFYISIAVDFIMGMTLLFNYNLKLWCWVQIGIITLYTVLISLLDPYWITQPYMPIMKNIPIIMATYLIIKTQK